MALPEGGRGLQGQWSPSLLVLPKSLGSTHHWSDDRANGCDLRLPLSFSLALASWKGPLTCSNPPPPPASLLFAGSAGSRRAEQNQVSSPKKKKKQGSALISLLCLSSPAGGRTNTPLVIRRSLGKYQGPGSSLFYWPSSHRGPVNTAAGPA